MRDSTSSKVLFLDVERAPSLGWVWGKWEQNVIDFKQDWYFLSFAWKWQGEKEIQVHSLPDYSLYRRDKENDIHLVKSLWNLCDKADIIIAHNGDRADLPWSRTRFIAHGMPPPKPFRTVDTCKIARRQFRFDSNKLDELGRYLGLGRKLPNTGFDLWKRCMEGDSKAWATMCDYNKQDVALLEQVYIKMRGWDTQHPPLQSGFQRCPKCSSANVKRQGFKITLQSRKQQFQCKDCAGWFLGKVERVA
jgi:hypothetical protein